eukprot:Macronucleus_3218.p1 GENE.Macronucleus_3218~~Macronucleus_3218.p1  ORF type:complete len:220 (+),score=79.17 Macronucleus_3218:1-660(+)
MVDGPQKKALTKVVLLGDINVGKTTLINRFTTGSAGSTSVTVGTDFKSKQITVNNTKVTMQIWDTAGQEKHVSIGFAFYRGSNSCILTFDVGSQESFDRLAFWKKNFLELAQPPNAAQFPFVVCGNKKDNSERVVTSEAARTWCSSNGGYEYFETCATTGEGVEELFQLTGKKALANTEDEEDFMPTSLSGAAGAIKIDRQTEKDAEQEKTKKKKKCKC